MTSGSADRSPGPAKRPALVVAGLRGDSGKTLVSLSLALAARARGIDVRGFKKGPDYIDAAWLEWATGGSCRNLDTFLMGASGARASFDRHAAANGLNLVEGNRGLYDGADPAGTDSTAELAKLLGAPVILVVDTTKATRTLAALVLGALAFDPQVRIAGVVLNRVAGARHERVIREAVETACSVPVVGVVPRLGEPGLLRGRHLGLVTPDEHGGLETLESDLLARVVPGLDIDLMLRLAGAPASPGSAGPTSGDQRRAGSAVGPRPAPQVVERAGLPRGAALGRPVIGYLRDSAFSFYYPDNLEALEAEGASLQPLSALVDEPLPDDLDLLYIGGGFPETDAARLSACRRLLASVAAQAAGGLPIYAECGGLMLLARALVIDLESRGAPATTGTEGRYEMAGVLPFDVRMERTPQGHGYVELVIESPNPFFAVGATLRGHEFHYSRVARVEGGTSLVGRVNRGSGVAGARDGVVVGSTWASYTHVHALGCPEWAPGLVRAARDYRTCRTPVR